ncbi:unnamed protein product [Nippostrongylus brasiliensis]|uniref:G_PROTEIN_RECEP_F1_2 domain-containing protein n=1 Tax=Nippostrongylus brasiliensis TaxID=27835 RepID=A0A0N4XVJ0_NIPBR|nr:unnamed protein product [Nippostrongylus brasiliensis]
MSSEALAYSTYIMASYAAVLSTLGLFGNVNLLWMTIRKKSMHTKPVLAPSVAEVWSTSTLVINSAVVVVYVSIILTMHCRKNSMETHESRRVVRRLKVIALVFICSWYMAILGVNVGEAFGLSPDGLMIFQSNMEQVAMMRCKTSPVTMNNSQTSKFLTVVNAK